MTTLPRQYAAAPNLNRPAVAWSVVAETVMAIAREACRDRRADHLADKGQWLLKALAALGISLTPPHVSPVRTTGPPLSDREVAVLCGMSEGKSNANIGRELFVTEDTVKTHARRIFKKRGAHAVAQALRRELID